MTDLRFVKPPEIAFRRYGYTHTLWVQATDSAHGGITFDLLAQAPHGGSVGLEGPRPYTLAGGELVMPIRWWKREIPKRLEETITFRLVDVTGADVPEAHVYEVYLDMPVVTDAKLKTQKETGRWAASYLPLKPKQQVDVQSPS
jgi:hypothetical protein